MEQILARIGEMARDGLIPPEALQSIVEEWDPVIRVSRTVAPSYPDWRREILHPELELTGAAEYDIRRVEQWLHPKQKQGFVDGNEIHNFLKNNNLLAGCLGLSDLLAIQARGIVFFRRHFVGKIPFGWRNPVRNHDGSLDVPYLIEDEGKVIVFWLWLGSLWDSDDPALRFANQSSGI